MNSIKIGWKTYDIRYTHVESDLVKGDECYGAIDHQEQIIRLRAANSLDQNRATLIHEALHGIDEMYSLELSEKTVTVLADALYTVLVDNGLTIIKEG